MPRRNAIATVKKRKPRAPRRAARPARARRAPARTPAADHPIGEGVADGFALDRLAAPARMKRAPKKAVRELGWAAFGEVARTLAAQIAKKFRPTVVVGIAKGGVFAGGALAAALGADFYPVRLEKRRRDVGVLPEPIQEQLPDLSGKRVLVVDDVAQTGATLARARALVRKSGARDVKTAVLVARPRGARPDFAAFATDELILFGWDYELAGSGATSVDPGEVGV
jgi:hypoxanthine phosphoribosyltransferase